ncbi:MAG: RNA polymerase sigma factor [Dysgonamonadaceae bacterium]|jgi:RNA polymerase sigma-70 factor (ECF subfamily)|nr:RNA polymerase sigma factor [Dysgonamonadaceae bacterium]
MNKVQFQQKILSLQDNMFNFALMLTTNREDARDLLQETTLKALDNHEKYVENVNFKGWVMTIMRNIFINDYRKMITNSTIIDQTEDLYHLNLPQTSGFETPESSLAVQEINNAIKGLNKDLKIPFSLYVAGYKYEEISNKLKLPMGTVKNRIFLARKELQCALKEMV